MDTVQLQCGSCNKRMAISAEHQGKAVRCPHCGAIVQTPPVAPIPTPIPPAKSPPDLFSDAGAVSAGPPLPRVGTPPFASDNGIPDDKEESALPTFKPRPIYDRSLIPLIALIFLVPYAFFTTLFIAYLIFFSSKQPQRADPLEFLRDPAPNPKNGGPRKVERPKHDQPLQGRITKLRQPLEVGELSITPERIRVTSRGNLQLMLRAKNISKARTSFEPIHPEFVALSFKEEVPKPYSFIESLAEPKTMDALYGMDRTYHESTDPKDDDEGSDRAVLKPGEEIIIGLETYAKFRDPQVATILKGGDYLWRVHVRRGFVKVDDKDKSATTVIGVEFSSTQIERKG